MSQQSDKVLEVIKETFNDYYKELIWDPKLIEKYGERILHLRQGIKEGMFTNKYSFKRDKPCIYNKYDVMGNTIVYKDFIGLFLKDDCIRQFYDYLVKVNYEMILYRGVLDNKNIKYFPSRTMEGEVEYAKIPFSTSTSLEFVKKWIDKQPCCIYVIHINFSRFKKFYIDRKLDYIPFIYLDEIQNEFTLGPGRLIHIRKEMDVNGILYSHIEYDPIKIDEDWDRSMYSEC